MLRYYYIANPTPSSIRLISLDFLRVLTAFSVVFFHIINESYWHLDWLGYKTWLISSGLGWLFAWGVAMFILTSGYLLLANYHYSSAKSFYHRRLSRLFIPFLFWNLFYYFLNHPPSQLSDFFSLLWQKGTSSHLYFMHVLFGFYLITPILVRFLPKIPRKFFPFILWISFLPAVFYQYARGFLSWPEPSSLLTWFIPFFPYYLAGYWLSWAPAPSRPQINFGISLIVLLLAIYITRKLYFIFPIHEQDTILVSSLSPPIILSALLIFSAFRSLKNSSTKVLLPISSLSRYTLGIYLIHPFYLRLLSSFSYYHPLMREHYWIWLSSTFFLVSLFSFTSTWLIQKIPVLSRIV